MRYFICFSFFGKAYHGWQNQPNAITVQQVLEKALTTLLRAKIDVVGAGRTDTGVHAKEMYAHFDSDEIEDRILLKQRLNAFLPDDIAIRSIQKVKADAHARFDAFERTYEYWVIKEKDPFYKNATHLVKLSLDVEAMNRAASILLQYHDFECFSKSNTDVKTFLCNIKEAVWSEQGRLLVFTITADRFLRNMVRAIVGTLLDIGMGKRASDEMHNVIKSKSRSKAGVSVPAKGLYLTQVSYQETIFDE
ncbi:MAG: tRNA pseudouridine(38-40) synthase TruA [Bacteroidota bacterium]